MWGNLFEQKMEVIGHEADASDFDFKVFFFPKVFKNIQTPCFIQIVKDGIGDRRIMVLIEKHCFPEASVVVSG